MAQLTSTTPLIATTLIVLACSACSGSGQDEVVSGPPDVSVSQPDTGAGIVTDTGAANDDVGGVDTVKVDSTVVDTKIEDAAVDTDQQACPGGDGCPCTDNSECNGGVCLDTHEGKRCAAKCTDTCAKGYACKDIGDGSPLFYCVSTRISLCSPCQFHSDCQVNGVDSLCVEYGDEGKFCGSPCEADNDCPQGYGCKSIPNGASGEVSQCVKSADDAKAAICECSDWAIAKGATTLCTVTNEAGQCSAKRSCDSSGLAACSAATPEAESCNGLDDDCDGQTDVLGPTASCKIKAFTNKGSQAACTQDTDCTVSGEACDLKSKQCKELLGACPGKPICDDKGTLICTGAANPQQELCDQIDNDCDGQTDEDFSWTFNGQPLVVGTACGLGACSGGVVSCASTSEATCASLSNASTETCDGIDNDCDGQTDNSACDDQDACTKDTCDSAQKSCTNTPAVDCDDKDDCTTDSCDKVSGACAYVSYLGSCDDGNACTIGDSCGKDPDKGVHTCIPGIEQPKCDDSNPCTDDLCDTQKGCVNAANASSQPCYTGAPKTQDVGECKSGVSYCKDGKLQGACVNETLPKAKETCDGKDQNCDGVTDEGCAPTDVNLTFIGAKVQGQSGKLAVEMLVGQSSPSGDSANNKFTMNLGFLAWLQALTK